MSEINRRVLLENIDILRGSGPSVLLVKCLLIAGLTEEAKSVSIELAPSQMANASTGARGLILSDWTEVQLRAIFCNDVAGYRHNAKVLFDEMISTVSSGLLDRATISPSVLTQVAIAAVFAGDDSSATAARGLVEAHGGFALRLLLCWSSKNMLQCRSVLDELLSFIDAEELQPWADTWHHLLILRVRQRCSAPR